jgi:hypothetical protein
MCPCSQYSHEALQRGGTLRSWHPNRTLGQGTVLVLARLGSPAQAMTHALLCPMVGLTACRMAGFKPCVSGLHDQV